MADTYGTIQCRSRYGSSQLMGLADHSPTLPSAPNGVRAALAAALSLLIFGCDGGEARQIPPVQQNLGPAKAFKEFTLYFLGRTYGGLPMTNDGSRAIRAYRPQTRINFTYGQCTPEGEHQTCQPPVRIANYGCAYVLRGSVPRRSVTVRGARAKIYYDYGVFESVRIATGRTTVAIQANDERSALRIARALRSVNSGVSARSDFPPPTRLTDRLRARLCGAWEYPLEGE